MWEWKGVDKEEVMSHTIRSYSIVCRARFTEESLRWVNLRTNSRLNDRFCTRISHLFCFRTEGGILYLVLRPRTRPKTFLQCFALEQQESKLTKQNIAEMS